MAITTVFKERTFDDLVKPLLLYKAAYDEAEKQWDEYATDSEQLQRYISMLPEDNPYRKRFEKYENDRMYAQNDFFNGMTAANMGDLRQIKRRNKSEIRPMKEAIASYKALYDERRKAEAANPTLRYEKTTDELNWTDLMDNPMADYGRSYSGALLTQQVGQAASAIAKAMETEEGIKSIGLPFQYRYRLRKGFKPADVMAVIMDDVQKGDPTAVKFLTGIVDNVMGSAGILNWSNDAVKNELRGFANQGLYNAMGEISSQMVTDSAGLEAYRHRLSASDNPSRKGLLLNPMNLYSTRKLSEEEKEFNNKIKEYADYFIKDEKTGKYVLSKKGLKEYQRKEQRTGGTPIVTPEGTTILTNSYTYEVDSPFKKFLDSNNITLRTDSENKVLREDFDKLTSFWNGYLNDSPASKTAKYDATKETVYEYSISDDSNWKRAIQRTGATQLPEIDYNPETGQFEDTYKNSMTMEELINDKVVILSRVLGGSRGDFFKIRDEKGNTRWYRSPSGMHIDAETNVRKSIDALEEIRDRIYNNPNLSEEDLYMLQKEYYRHSNNAYSYNSLISTENKEKPQEFEPSGF